MAKKRPMTNAERVHKHRASAARLQINVTLNSRTISKLDKKAKQADQTRSEYIATQIEGGQASKTTVPTVAQTQPIAAELNAKEQLAVLHMLTQVDNDYLQQIAVDGISAQRMRRAINRTRKVLEAQNPEPQETPESKIRPANVTSNDKAKSTRSKKKVSKKRASRTNSPPPKLDAIGLGRPDTFRDSPSAVSVSAEIKDLSKISKRKQWMDWRSLPRKFMAVWEAQKYIDKFRKAHREATIEQRHMTEDKTLMEVIATYADERPDHRVVYQARGR